MTQRKKYSGEEKLNVLIQAGQKGISNVLRRYNISYSLFARWNTSFQKKGIDLLNARYCIQKKGIDFLSGVPGNLGFAEENLRLKKISGDQASSLELRE